MPMTKNCHLLFLAGGESVPAADLAVNKELYKQTQTDGTLGRFFYIFKYALGLKVMKGTLGIFFLVDTQAGVKPGLLG